MWIEDFSGVKEQFDRWRECGIQDIRAYLKEDVSCVAACSQQIRILRVNRKTLDLFEAQSLDHLVANLSSVFRDEMLESHVNELQSLAGTDGVQRQRGELHLVRPPAGYPVARGRPAGA